MSTNGKAIAYYIYKSHKISFKAEEIFKNNPGLKQQGRCNQVICRLRMLEQIESYKDVVRGSPVDLFQLSGFQKALAHAEREGAILLIYDVVKILSGFLPDHFDKPYAALVDQSVRILDSSLNIILNDIPKNITFDLALGRRVLTVSRRYSAPKNKPSAKANKRSVLIRRIEADKFAGTIYPVIIRIEKAAIASGKKATLSYIAQSLNEKNIKTHHQRSWTPTAVSRVKKKIREIEAARAKREAEERD